MVTGRSCYKPSPATGKPRHRGWSSALGSVYIHSSGPFYLHPQLQATLSTPTASGHSVYTHSSTATLSAPTAPSHSVYTHSSRATLSAPTLGHSVYAHNSGPVFTSTIPGPLHLHSQLRATPPALTAPGPFCSHSTSGQHCIYTQNSGPPRLRPQLRDLAASPTPCSERQLGARTGKPAQGCVAAPHSQSWGLRRRPLVRQCGRPGCRTGNSGVREDSAPGARRRWASQAPRARPCLDPGPSGPAAAPPPGRSRAGEQKEGGGGRAAPRSRTRGAGRPRHSPLGQAERAAEAASARPQKKERGGGAPAPGPQPTGRSLSGRDPLSQRAQRSQPP